MKKQIYFTACVIVLASFIGIACASSGETTDVTAVRNIDNRFSTRTYNLSDYSTPQSQTSDPMLLRQ